MDREPEEFQFMGLFGIYKESYKLIFSWKKIFSQFTLALFLPLSFIFFAEIQLSEFLLSKIYHNKNVIFSFHSGSPTYNQIRLFQAIIRSGVTFEWVVFWLFQAVYFIVTLTLSLLYKSAVIYTIGCIYTSKLQNISFTRVMTAVPKVWKRVMVTYLWNFVILFVYHAVAAVVAVLFIVLIPQNALVIVILSILTICYLIGVYWIRIVWQLASIVSVLEDVYGIKALIKSKELIKGKMWVASFTYLTIQFCLSVIQWMSVKLLVMVVPSNGTKGGGSRIGSRVGYGLLSLVLLYVFVLIGHVNQTVIYFVCKSYHHKNVDRSCLADHLEAVYVPLNSKYVPLESSEV